jgi:hypothetical protein
MYIDKEKIKNNMHLYHQEDRRDTGSRIVSCVFNNPCLFHRKKPVSEAALPHLSSRLPE